MSRNFKIFALATAVLTVAGLMNDATVMFVLAGVCAAVMLVCYLLSALSLSRLEVELAPPASSAVANTDLRPRIMVRSTGGIAIGSAAIELEARNLTVEGVAVTRRVLLPHLPPGSEVEVDLELRPPLRGRYSLGPPAVVDSDPLGMFDQRREHGDATELMVFPQTWDVPRVATWDTGSGAYSSTGRQPRQDRGEFRGIREHTPGDDLRHVHWKVTAHVGELAVKEYEPLRHDLISIHLDLTEADHYGEGPQSSLETAISAAASIARAGLAEQRSVSLMGAGLAPQVGRAGTGQAHMHRIMVSLAEATTGEEAFADVLSRQLRLVPRGASVFVLTTGIEAGLVQALARSSTAAGSVMLLVIEGDRDSRGEVSARTPRTVVQEARAAGISAAILRSPADIGDAVSGVHGGFRRSEAEVI